MKIVITLDGQPDPTSLEVPDKTSVAELVESIAPDIRLADVKALVNRQSVPLDRILRPRDRVHLAWTQPADSH